MSRLDEVLAAARAENRAALVGYLPAGYPSVQGAADAMTAMVRGGVDIVEVGLPYSDPLMDGPTIQEAVEAALVAGTTTDDVVTTVRQVAATGAPTLVMSYWNPVERYGALRFAEALADAGCAGVITPDLLPDEAGAEPSDWLGATDATGLARVFLVAPSSTDERLARTAEHCRGFVYAASTMGVTGTRDGGRWCCRGARATDPRGHGHARLRRARRLERGPGRPGRGLRRRRHRGLGVRPRPARRAPRPEAGCTAVGELAAELADGVRRGRS